MPIDITDRAAFEAVVAHAEREGKLNDLGEKLHWLDAYGGDAMTRCVLSSAPPPFTFDLVMFEHDGTAWRPLFVGRLHYQMPDSRDGHAAAPTFAVSITSTRNNHMLSQIASA